MFNALTRGQWLFYFTEFYHFDILSINALEHRNSMLLDANRGDIRGELYSCDIRRYHYSMPAVALEGNITAVNQRVTLQGDPVFFYPGCDTQPMGI